MNSDQINNALMSLATIPAVSKLDYLPASQADAHAAIQNILGGMCYLAALTEILEQATFANAEAKEQAERLTARIVELNEQSLSILTAISSVN